MKKIVYTIAFFSCFCGQVYANSLLKDFRNSIGDIIKDTCHSSINYSIDDSVGFDFLGVKSHENLVCKKGKCKEYHKTINCILDSSVSKNIKELNKEVRKSTLKNVVGQEFGQALTSKFMKPKSSSCQGFNIDTIASAQQSNGFISKCSKEFSSDTASRDSSLCHAAEMALNEYCGYEKFLIIKTLDKESFIQEFQVFNEVTTMTPKIVKEVFLRERKNSKQALRESFNFYKKLEYTYMTNLLMESIWFHISVLHNNIGKFTKAVSTFPAKFLDRSKN